MKIYSHSIFIFRRDLRLEDNTGLIAALEKSIFVIPIFIFTPEQLVNNKFKSDNCVQFMMESLDDLDRSLKKNNSRLFYFFGKQSDVVEKIIKKMKIEAVFVNRDYTPYSKKRDDSIKKLCENKKIKFESYEDILLLPVSSVKTVNGTIYSKFTPFFNSAKKKKVRKIRKNSHNNYYSKNKKIVGEFTGNKEKFCKNNVNLAVHGGRTLAITILNGLQKFKNYNKERNFLAVPTTTLSAYIKFGCVSIREVYYKIKEKLSSKNDLIKQLYWREFYYNVTENSPRIASNNWNEKNIKQQYNKVPWLSFKKANSKQKNYFKAWQNGKTGFPIVDACMNEMNITGFMHNRGRLIVASFLIKDLMFHWAEGEKYFSNKLIDLDLANNTNNWLWVSGAGEDSQPFFRIFNPWRQQKKFDPKCEYIKKWIPELKNVPIEDIHNWNYNYKNYPDINYPSTIIDHSSKAKKTLSKYKKALAQK